MVGPRWDAETGLVTIDQERLIRIVGGDIALATELLEMLIAEIPCYRAELEAAVRARDMSELAKVAHTIAGGAAYCGAIALKAAAYNLEEATQRAAELEGHAEIVYAEMQKILDQFPTRVSLPHS